MTEFLSAIVWGAAAALGWLLWIAFVVAVLGVYLALVAGLVGGLCGLAIAAARVIAFGLGTT